MSILTDAVLDQIQSFVLWVVGLFPNVSTLPAPNLAPVLKHADLFINMTLFTSLLAIFLAYEGLVIIVRAILLVWGTLKP